MGIIDIFFIIHIMSFMDNIDNMDTIGILEIISLLRLNGIANTGHPEHHYTILLVPFGNAELPLAAGGKRYNFPREKTAAESPQGKSGRYDISGRRSYSANRPLDCLPAPPGVGERYEQPKGSSWSLHLLASARSGGPPHRQQYQGARCQFCHTNRPLSGPSLPVKTRLRVSSTPFGALCYTMAILPPYAGGGAPCRRG